MVFCPPFGLGVKEKQEILRDFLLYGDILNGNYLILSVNLI